MLQLPVGVLQSIELRLVLLEGFLVAFESLDDNILLIGLNSVGGDNPIFVAVGLAIFLPPVALHPN